MIKTGFYCIVVSFFQIVFPYAHWIRLLFSPFVNRFNLFHPETNIYFGAWYLRWLLKLFDGRVTYALAAYNAGPGVVKRWIKRAEGREMEEFIEDIPYRETRNYVKKVLAYYEAYRRLYGVDLG